MTDRELDVQIAEQILAIKKIFQPRDYKRADDALWGADEYSFIPSGKSPRTHMIDAKPVPYFSSDISCAMQVEDRIAELELQGLYVRELNKAVGTSRAVTQFELIHATPRERCLAALAASKKGKVEN